MAVSFQILASGSKGNAMVVSSSRTRILIDAGLTSKELHRRLHLADIDPAEIQGAVLTHEHQDHVRGAGVFSRRYDLPVYLTQGTLDSLSQQVGTLGCPQVFRNGHGFQVGDLRIIPFAISHDANDPVGLTVENDGVKLGICTDLGVATQLVRKKLEGCHAMVLEANHDVDLLLNGPYPWHLKQRIRSRHGHLSNADSCALLKELLHDGLQVVVLAHLSETNNRPELVRDAFHGFSQTSRWREIRIEVGQQHAIGGAIDVR
ncbi:MAG TPA: MBL fold metallo-hydrolase [Syntrophobacteraceae bacterium]|nr:MBL fold metallo-hydrolase [Syntrophobacteraceae bacterium]HBD08377.1 MBL fold metallo-hydrolase [Syntrophobacteraceae bacterium]HBZ54508.1 MBL fold metallo-hydrolase [Syntrophobacteraceae bacterium]